MPGSEQLVFGALNGSVAIVDGDKGDVVKELPAHERPVLALAVLDKPGIIATGGGDGVIRVLRSADGSQIEEYRNPYGPVWALAFAADGTALYYGGLDDFATLWRITPREPFEPIESSFPRRFQVRGEAGNDQIAAGELQFARKCSVCHTVQADGRNRAGPHAAPRVRTPDRHAGGLPLFGGAEEARHRVERPRPSASCSSSGPRSSRPAPRCRCRR